MDPFNPTPEDLLPEAIADRSARWITDLPPFKKATCALMDPKTSGRCCLGVAGHLAGIQDEKLKGAAAYEVIQRLYGLRAIGNLRDTMMISDTNRNLCMPVGSLICVNDSLYPEDLDHARTAAFIRANVDLVWDEPLAGLIKERLG